MVYNQSQGARQSLNENLIPELFFNDINSLQKNVEGVSAVKAIKLAAEQGQKIYQIDRNNINTILPMLSHDSSVITDIRNAVASGKVVITSEKSINFNGWKGSGYIVLDPNTSSGAYMISGGLDGGATYAIGAATGFALMGLLAMIGKMSLALASPYGLLFGIIALILVMLIVLVIQIAYLSMNDKELQKCYLGGILTGMTFGGVFNMPSYLGRIIAMISGVANMEMDTNNRRTCAALP